ncbi:hypothetical protein [Catellatospora vulcania]|uniref:hypothetical protein n=1 Tax=Catellatospora vulcania TaxID=1460450 RepID=UPI0012D4351C|nr:hypothetical protein [Catellatospora vulcania]
MWSNALSFGGGVLAAVLAASAALRVNRTKMAGDTKARWEAVLFDKSAQLAEAARSLRHHSERYRHSSDKDARKQRIDDAQEKLRIAMEQLRLVGNRRVQVAARVVMHHAYAVAVQGVDNRDPRADRYTDTPPIARLNDALQEFYRAVRQQLRAADPEDVLHDDDLARIADGLQPLTPEQRSSIV